MLFLRRSIANPPEPTYPMSTNQTDYEVAREYDSDSVPDKAPTGLPLMAPSSAADLWLKREPAVNKHYFPALRTGSLALSGASRQKQIFAPPPISPDLKKTKVMRRSEKLSQDSRSARSIASAERNPDREGTKLLDLIRAFAVMLFLIFGIAPASAGIRIYATAESYQNTDPDITTNTISNFSPAIGEGCKLVVCVSWEKNSTAAISSVTYAGLTLIRAVTADDIQRSSIWYLDLGSASPATGNVVVTFQTPTDSRIGALSLQETAPGAPAQTVALTDSNTASITTTIPDALVVGVFTEDDQTNNTFTSTLENTLYKGSSGSSKGLASYQHEPATGLKTYSWVSDYTNNNSAVVLAAFTYKAVGALSTKQNYASSAIAKNTIPDFTVPLGVNRKLVVVASWDGSATISAVKYGTQTLTKAVGAETGSAGRKVEIWYLDAPAFGTANVEVDFNAATVSRVGAVCLENVALGVPAQTHQVIGAATANLTTTAAQAMVVGVYTETKPSGSTAYISSNFATELYTGPCGSNRRGYAGFQSAPNAGLHIYNFTNSNGPTGVIALAAFNYLEPTTQLDPAAIDFVMNDTTNRQRQKHLLTVTMTPAAVGAQTYALSAYWLNNQTQMTTADTELIKLKTDGWYDAQMVDPKDDFHWSAYVLARIYFLYSSHSPRIAHRMSQAAEDAVLDMLWGWASDRCKIGMFDDDTTFYSWGSENHHSMSWIGYWSIARIMAEHPVHRTRNYDDGTTPAAMAAAADKYFKAYARHRALNGTMIEASAPAYNSITMNTWLSLVDFATDPELIAAASSLIDIYWANWAIEQINGVKGGSRNRSKPGRESVERSASEDVAWYFLGIGTEPFPAAGAVAATSSWRPSRAVVALALDTEARGEYAYISRRLGLKDPNPLPELASPGNEFPWNPLNPLGGDLLRYTWTTPDFVMGTAMMRKLPSSDWIQFSSQDRWNGIIFTGPKTARIFTQVPYNGNDRSVYNTEWGVQDQGVAILQRISTAVDATGQMVWFSTALNLDYSADADGWIFAESLDAFAAVRIVTGGWDWVPDGDEFQRNDIPDDLGKWAVLRDQFSPIIIEVARKEDYNWSFSRFKADIKDNLRPFTNNSKLDYTSSKYNTKLTLFADESALPQVNDVTVNLAPPEAYSSPYLNGDVAEGPVIIQYGGDQIVHGVAPFAADGNHIHHWTFDSSTSIPYIQPASTGIVIPENNGRFGNFYRINHLDGNALVMTGSKWPSNKGTVRYRGWFRLRQGDNGGYLFHVYNQVYLRVSPTTAKATFTINKSGDTANNSATNVVTIVADIDTDNDWQYIEAYYDGTTIMLVTEPETVAAPGIGNFVPNAAYATRPIYIGSRINNDNYVGDMDEVKITAP